jgi:hypothetical protein
LNHSRATVVAGAKNAAGALFAVENQTKRGIGTPVIWRAKAGMIQNIEELETDCQYAAFPAWYFGALS